MRNRMVVIFTTVSLLLIIIVLGFSGWLNIVTFKKNYVTSLVTSYTVAGGEARRKIEYAVRYGKPLTNFYAVQELLGEINTYSEGAIENVRILRPDALVMYALQEGEVGSVLPRELASKVDFGVDRPNHPYDLALSEGKYHAFIPIRDKQNTWIASIDMVFDEAVVNREVNAYVWPIIEVMLLIAALASFCLVVFFWLIPILDTSGQIRKKRILTIFVLVLGIAQLAFVVTNTSNFKSVYVNIAQKNTLLAATIIEKDINRVVQLGVPYHRLADMEGWLQRIINSVPEIESIYITDSQDTILHAAPVANKVNQPIEMSNLHYSMPLISDQTGVSATLHIVLSQSYVDNKVNDILIDALTVSLISFFFMIEFVLFVLLFINLKAVKYGGEEDETVTIGIIRPLAFLFFIATDMSISFIPMQMKNLYEPLFGLSQNTVMGLPISVEMLCASLTAISTGFILDKKGWRFPFFIGLSILFVGVLLSGLAWSALVFIIARGIVGTGFGFAWMAMRGYVAANPSSASRAKGFSQLNAGIYAGNICACALGAMLAERMGYAGVFFIAVAIVLLTAAFAATLVKDPTGTAVKAESKIKLTKTKWNRFFGDASVIGLMLLITVPSALCLTGFLNYFFPIYSNQIGISPANTGRAFMIYGICIIYLGPFFGKYISKSQNLKKLVVCASCIGVIALLLFSLRGGIIAALVAVFLFGVADSIGFIAQNTFLLNLSVTKAFGEGKALGFFSMTKKLGQMLGPLVFAGATGVGAEGNIGWIGAAYFFVILLFLLATRQGEKDVVLKKE